MVSEPLAVPDVLNPSTQTVCDVLVIEVGIAEFSVAVPPEIDKVKSATSKSPLPLVVSYTLSLKLTVKALLSELRPTLLIIGAVVSKLAVTTPEPLMTAIPAFPAISLKAILKVTTPDVSLAFAVYAAVQVFPLVFVYVTEVSVIAAPPELKVTTGVDIGSDAVNVRFTMSFSKA